MHECQTEITQTDIFQSVLLIILTLYWSIRDTHKMMLRTAYSFALKKSDGRQYVPHGSINNFLEFRFEQTGLFKCFFFQK